MEDDVAKRIIRNAPFAVAIALLAIGSQVNLFEGWPAIAWLAALAVCMVWLVVTFRSLSRSAQQRE